MSDMKMYSVSVDFKPVGAKRPECESFILTDWDYASAVDSAVSDVQKRHKKCEVLATRTHVVPGGFARFKGSIILS